MSTVADEAKKFPEELPEKLPDDAAVFVGAVRALGSPPSAWSGRFAMYQEATFDVGAVLAPGPEGTLGKQIALQIQVVKGSPLAKADAPGLSAEVLSSGSRWLIAIAEDEKLKRPRVVFVTPWSKEREAKAREKLAKGGAKKEE